MPPKSKTENVRKICACKKWKLYSHAWYLDYQRDGVRYRDNLDKLIGRHAADFIEAKDEARRAIIAKLNGRDPKDLQPSDDPTVLDLLTEYDRERPRRDRYQVPQVLKTPVPSPGGALRPFGEWWVSTVNVDTLKRFRQARPRIAGNRDLTLLRAAFNWAVLQGLVPTTPFRVGGVPTLRLGSETARTRRLQPGEAERLLDAAGSRSGLRDRITAALEDRDAAGRDLVAPGASGAVLAAGGDLHPGTHRKTTARSSHSHLQCASSGPRDAPRGSNRRPAAAQRLCIR